MPHVLAGAWRPAPAPVAGLSEAGNCSVLDSLLRTGTGGLAWWRIKESQEKCRPRTRRLREAYRAQKLYSVRYENGLRRAFGALTDAGLSPIVIKGWSVARLYPDPGLRPCGDIDVCVRPDEIPLAERILTAVHREIGASIDLHAGIPDLPDRSWSELYDRSFTVPVAGLSEAGYLSEAGSSGLSEAGSCHVRVLGWEDHFRLLCLHFLRHGGCRPLSLCDIAVCLESQPSGFDWDYCLSGRRYLSTWVLSAVSLAQQLLDAKVSGLSIARYGRTPQWLVDSVLNQWESASATDSRTTDASPFSASVQSVRRLPSAIRNRWPNPVESSIKMRRSPTTKFPKIGLRIAYFAKRGLRWMAGQSRRALPSLAATALSLHGPSEL